MTIEQVIKEMREIGERFRVFREHVGKTGEEFSRETGFPAEYILLIERGKVQPCLSFVEYFCSHYGMSISWLVKGKNNMIMKEEKIWVH